MSYQIHGKHLIAGNWIGSHETFESSPANGPKLKFSKGSLDLVNDACSSAEEAFLSYANSLIADRAQFLKTIADEIDSRGEDISEIGENETGLTKTRLEGERGRTIGQLRMFAEHILKGDYLDYRHDKALPDRLPAPRTELMLIQRPIGPVAVFGASNFPLAFSTAGGDTASALAAGCPVVYKGHSSHPGTSEIVADAIHSAIKKCNMPHGTFSLIQGGNREVGVSLVQNKNVKAVGFTGSLSGGRALFDLCSGRPEPIPFFGELGSVNPVFILPQSISENAEKLAEEWIGSLTLGVGQFCTNPGLVFLTKGDHSKNFIETSKKISEKIDSQVMLSDSIASSYRNGCDLFANTPGVNSVFSTKSSNRKGAPNLFLTDGKNWMIQEILKDEVFGPMGLIVELEDVNEMFDIAKSLEGQLTCTIHFQNEDENITKKLIQILERKAGRILANGFPTGVEVADAMVHGGPYPASTNFGATSVGTLSIRRFLRPVCYQNMPHEFIKAIQTS